MYTKSNYICPRCGGKSIEIKEPPYDKDSKPYIRCYNFDTCASIGKKRYAYASWSFSTAKYLKRDKLQKHYSESPEYKKKKQKFGSKRRFDNYRYLKNNDYLDLDFNDEETYEIDPNIKSSYDEFESSEANWNDWED